MPYEIKKTNDGKFAFNLKAANYEIILTSQSYEQKGSALDGIASVQVNGVDEANFESKTATNGQPYFVLKAKNGQVIGRSELYSSEAAARNGIASVQKNAPSTDIKDLTV